MFYAGIAMTAIKKNYKKRWLVAFWRFSVSCKNKKLTKGGDLCVFFYKIVLFYYLWFSERCTWVHSVFLDNR